jgi:hypothetical protein
MAKHKSIDNSNGRKKGAIEYISRALAHSQFHFPRVKEVIALVTAESLLMSSTVLSS